MKSGIHKITMREMELLATIKHEASGRLTRAMAAFLMGTTPQAIGRLSFALSRKGLADTDGAGVMRIN